MFNKLFSRKIWSSTISGLMLLSLAFPPWTAFAEESSLPETPKYDLSQVSLGIGGGNKLIDGSDVEYEFTAGSQLDFSFYSALDNANIEFEDLSFNYSVEFQDLATGEIISSKLYKNLFEETENDYAVQLNPLMLEIHPIEDFILEPTLSENFFYPGHSYKFSLFDEDAITGTNAQELLTDLINSPENFSRSATFKVVEPKLTANDVSVCIDGISFNVIAMPVEFNTDVVFYFCGMKDGVFQLIDEDNLDFTFDFKVGKIKSLSEFKFDSLKHIEYSKRDDGKFAFPIIETEDKFFEAGYFYNPLISILDKNGNVVSTKYTKLFTVLEPDVTEVSEPVADIPPSNNGEPEVATTAAEPLPIESLEPTEVSTAEPEVVEEQENNDVGGIGEVIATDPQPVVSEVVESTADIPPSNNGESEVPATEPEVTTIDPETTVTESTADPVDEALEVAEEVATDLTETPVVEEPVTDITVVEATVVDPVVTTATDTVTTTDTTTTGITADVTVATDDSSNNNNQPTATGGGGGKKAPAPQSSFKTLSVEEPVETLSTVSACGTPNPTFDDVQGHWAEDLIKQLAEMGAVSGKSQGVFMPNGNLTRAEAAKVLLCVKGVDVESDLEGFSDTKDHWADDIIATAKKHNFIKGYPGGEFKPNNPVTRSELVVMVFNAMGIDADTVVKASFTDLDQTMWYANAINFAVEVGILNGYGDGTVSPGNFVTRAEMSKIVIMALKKF